MSNGKYTFSRSTRIIIAVILSALGGGLLFLSYPPVNLWPLVWIALIPYLIAQFRFMPRRWSALAPTIGLTLFLWPYLGRIFGLPDAPFLFKNMGLLFGIATLFTSTERRFHEITNYKWFILQGIFAWVGFEMIRNLIPVLGTMGFVGNTQASQAWLLQPISIFSIFGLEFLIVLVNYSLAYLALVWIDNHFEFDDAVPVDKKASKKYSFITLGILAAWIVLSLFIYNSQPDTKNVRVAAIHSYYDEPGHQVDEAGQVARLEKFSGQAMEAAGQGAELIFFPEMGFGFDPQVAHTAELRDLAAQTGAYLFIPYAYHDESDGWHNETVILSPQGEFSTLYGKTHVFGEPPTVSSGKFPVKETQLGTIGSIICMDGVFTDAARNISKNGVQILGIPSYDSTIGISEHNWTHFLMRSVENQVPVINADRGLVSMITDAHGNIVAFENTSSGSDAVLVADVALGQGSSPYHYIGDLLGWVSLAGFIFFTVFQMSVEKRASKTNKKGKNK